METSRSSKEINKKGWLLKWTNYIKGYQPRWFVLSNGILAYYRDQAEMAHTCRGTINLVGALIHIQDACSFVVSNGTTQSFYLRASSEEERLQWVTALEHSKRRAIHSSELASEIQSYHATGHHAELLKITEILGSRIENLQTCYELVVKHGNELVKTLSQVERMETLEEAIHEVKHINERATLFRVTSNAMISNCKEYLDLVQFKIKNIYNILGEEENQRRQLEEYVEQLIAQYSMLEKAAKNQCLLSKDEVSNIAIPKQSIDTASHEENVQFFDALDSRTGTSDYSETPEKEAPKLIIERAGIQPSLFTTENPEVASTTASVHQIMASRTLSLTEASRRKKLNRRSRIPDSPNLSVNLWSIMKNCVGKDLSKIPMPVNFSEPISMLQRLAEEFAYSSVLDQAASCDNSCEQLAYIAAFTVSHYSTTAIRSAKPFNPLLGETFELDRTDDLGWRLISEQVSHHPPMAAQYCESENWRLWQEFTMSSKFRGSYLQVVPLGIAHLLFFKDKNHYTWRKVTTTVHNIIFGKLWVDQHGEMEIINHYGGSRCRLTYLPYSYFKNENQRRVKGCVFDSEGIAKWVIDGTWDKEVQIAPIIKIKGTKDNPIYDTGEYVTAWTCINPPPESEKYYNFSVFACQLNEMEEDVAPTDSRRRPDQRLMEDGKWDEANAIKVALEEKQRTVRKSREKMLAKANKNSGNLKKKRKPPKKESKQTLEDDDSDDECSDGSNSCSPYEPTWFKKEVDPITGNIIHSYTGGYWEAKEKQDWPMCPNIYL